MPRQRGAARGFRLRATLSRSPITEQEIESGSEISELIPEATERKQVADPKLQFLACAPFPHPLFEAVHEMLSSRSVRLQVVHGIQTISRWSASSQTTCKERWRAFDLQPSGPLLCRRECVALNALNPSCTVCRCMLKS